MHSNDNDDVIFVLDDSAGATRLVMTTIQTLKTPGGRTPLWWYQPDSEDALTAITVWLSEQRTLWPAWREISERDGIDAVHAEIKRLWSLSPLETCGAVMLNQGDDQRDITLFAMLVTRKLEIVRHRFETAEHKRAFLKFYFRDISDVSTFLLFEGCLIGPAHLNRVLDGVAVSELAKPESKTGSRRGAKQGRKVA